jgi:hypothetical protein
MALRFLLVTVLAVLAGSTHAEVASDGSAPRYAVLSLIGDALTIVTYQSSTGSSMDTNRHESIPMTGAPFDKTALKATDAALRKLDPETAIVLLTASSPSLYQEQEKLFSESRLTVPEEIVNALRRSGATRAIVLTKYRGDARLDAENRHLGSGKLSGLGFYVDRQHRLSRSDTGERGVGFLAPFVYVRLSLVDVATLAVLREEIVTAATTLSAARSKDTANPWDVLTPAQKVESINSMTTREVARAIPVLVGTH